MDQALTSRSQLSGIFVFIDLERATSSEGVHVNVLQSRKEKSILGSADGTLIWQSKRIHCVGAGAYNVLFPIYSVTHRTTRICPTKVYMPQWLAGFRIECHKVAVLPASEHQSARSRKHAALRIVDHLELPLRLARLRIDGPNCTISFGLGLVVGRHTPQPSRPDRRGRPISRGGRFPKAGPPTVSGVHVHLLPWKNGPFARKTREVVPDGH